MIISLNGSKKKGPIKRYRQIGISRGYLWDLNHSMKNTKRVDEINSLIPILTCSDLEKVREEIEARL